MKEIFYKMLQVFYFLINFQKRFTVFRYFEKKQIKSIFVSGLQFLF